MPAVTIGFAESALRDLEEVRAWYAQQGVPDVGARLVAEVFQRVQALADHPDMGRVVPEFISRSCANSSIRRFGSCIGAIPNG